MSHRSYLGNQNPNWKGGKLERSFNIYYTRVRNAIFELLGEKCVQCGFNDRRALQVDHINGDGSKEKERYAGRSRYYHILNEILKGNNNYQILCANCNWIKRHINHEERS